MARIVGVDIPNDKRVVVSITYIYGMVTQQQKRFVKPQTLTKIFV